MGSTYEREFVNRLEDNDIPALRIPASGSGGTKDLPDVLVSMSGKLVAVEHKKTAGDYAYLEEDEIEALCRFARDWNAIPLGVVRFTHDTNHYVVSLSEPLELTDGGRLSVKRDEKESYPTTLEYAQDLELKFNFGQ